ncbi:BQ2448_1682 [Microbotryum intermedium]|uniref:Protein-serine/threonine kinase n=1 Tax=Microbotryum intermedium TaxID=269621 RepID=A0A238FGL5_9BASI|nr:BQ2448_1682 [Microbotryum intermedium]
MASTFGLLRPRLLRPSVPLRRHAFKWLQCTCSYYTATSEAYPSSATRDSRSSLPQSPAPPHATASAQDLLAHYSQIPTRTVKLSDLTQYGTPPLSQDKLLESGERTRKQLLAGLARRVTQHLSLPFLPATNPSLQSVYKLYSSAFFELVAVPEIKTLEDNDALCSAMSNMVEEHRDNIPILAKGFQETRKYLTETTVTQFLDRAIRDRISLRLMAEQHLSLSAASMPALRPSSSPVKAASSSTDPRVEPSARAPSLPSTSLAPSRVGVLDLSLNLHELVTACADYVTLLCEATYGVAPAYRIEGAPSNATVGSIGSHLEYILTELLKNAFRATVEHHTPEPEEEPGVFRFDDLPHAHLNKEDFPEVVVTIGVVKGLLTIRIRDLGGGVPPENVASIFSYAFTSVKALPDPDADPDSPESDLYGGASGAGYYGGVGGGPQGGESTLKTSMGTLAGLGFGLPLSRIYSGYFGGSLELVTMHGWGTDVYCVIRVV